MCDGTEVKSWLTSHCQEFLTWCFKGPGAKAKEQGTGSGLGKALHLRPLINQLFHAAGKRGGSVCVCVCGFVPGRGSEDVAGKQIMK